MATPAWHNRLAALISLGEEQEHDESRGGDKKERPNVYEHALEKLCSNGDCVEAYTDTSRRIAETVERADRLDLGDKQSKVFRSLKYEDLADDAQRVKQMFSRLLATLSVEFAAAGVTCRIIEAPIKGAERAKIKSTIKYGGDVSLLVDLVRATIVFSSLKDMYCGVEMLVNSHVMSGRFYRVASFEDRYQQPLTGGYSDLQLVIGTGKMVCELQVNTEEMIEAKAKGGGHHEYEISRFVHEHLLYATVTADWVGFQALAASGLVKNPDLVKDPSGYRALHFCAQHRKPDMVRFLLNMGASPFQVSKDGYLALSLAISTPCWDSALALVDAMSASMDSDFLEKPKLRTALHLALSAMLEIDYVSNEGSEGEWSLPLPLLVATAALVVKMDSPVLANGTTEEDPLSCWHTWADAGTELPLLAVKSMLADETDGKRQEAATSLLELLQGVHGDEPRRASALDIAAGAARSEALPHGVPPLAQLLAELGGRFSLTKFFYQAGARSLDKLRTAASKGNQNVKVVLEQLRLSPEHYRSTVLWWDEDANPFGMEGSGSSGPVLHAQFGASTLDRRPEGEESGVSRKTWSFPPVPAEWRGNFQMAEMQWDIEGIKEFSDAAGLAEEVVAFLREAPEHGPLAVVLDTLDVMSIVSLGQQWRFLRELLRKVNPCRIRLVLLLPEESASRQTSSATYRAASWQSWPISVAQVFANTLATVKEAADNARTGGDGAATWLYDCGPNIHESADGDMSEKSRPYWLSMRDVAPRIVLIDKEQWSGAGRNRQRGSMLSAALSELQLNTATCVGIGPSDLRYLFGKTSPFSKMIEKGSSLRARYCAEGFDDMEIDAWRPMALGFSKRIEMNELEYVALSAHDDEEGDAFAVEVNAKSKVDVGGIHVECIGAEAAVVAQAAGLSVHPYNSLALPPEEEDLEQWRRQYKNKILVIVDPAEFKTAHFPDPNSALSRSDWSTCVLCPPLTSPTVDDNDDSLSAAWISTLVILTRYVDFTFGPVLLVSGQDDAGARALPGLRALRDVPSTLEILAQHMPYPRIRYYVYHNKEGCCVAHGVAAATGGEGVQLWRNDMKSFLDGGSVVLPDETWDGSRLAENVTTQNGEREVAIFDVETTEEDESPRFARPLFVGSTLHLLSGTQRHRLGPDRMLSASSGAYAPYLVEQGALDSSLVRSEVPVEEGLSSVSFVHNRIAVVSVLRCGMAHLEALLERASGGGEAAAAIFELVGEFLEGARLDEFVDALKETLEDARGVAADYRDMAGNEDELSDNDQPVY